MHLAGGSDGGTSEIACSGTARKCEFLGWEIGIWELFVEIAQPDTTGQILGGQSGDGAAGILGGGGKIKTASWWFPFNGI